MMKKLLLFVFLSGIFMSVFAQEKQPAKMSYDAKMAWWRDAKLGLFVTWGPYCLYGGVYNGLHQRRGGAEWIMNRCKIPVREYRAKASTFNPQHFDADKLVLMAKESGMKYIVFTTKHHDGFAMFKSNASRFNIMDYTSFGRDIVDELVNACRKHGMKLGFYYSQAQDWCNPGGIAARKLMKEGWANPDSVEIDAFTATHQGAWDAIQRTRSFKEYFYDVALPQIKELLERYSDVAVFWFDTPISITKQEAGDIMAELEKYPHIIINDRLRRPDYPGDYKTPEGLVPKADDVRGVDWETCMNIGSSWGYKSWENQWKSSQVIIRNTITIAARGGNYLLNVGPDAMGDIPEEAQARLQDLGTWMKTNGEAIYGSMRSNIHPAWGECTRKDMKKNSVLYLCVFDWPADGKLILDGNYRIRQASLLDGQKGLKYKAENGRIVIELPPIAPDPIASVVKLELKEKLAPIKVVSNTAKVFKIQDE